LSTKDKMTKNESKSDFLYKISKDFVCIFQIFQFSSEIEAKWKGNFENDLYWLWPWNIKMYQTQWNFHTCLQWCFLIWAISSYFISAIIKHPVVFLPKGGHLIPTIPVEKTLVGQRLEEGKGIYFSNLVLTLRLSILEI
jgi:hypothetical protein